jgi:hypothetical protein
MKKITPMQIKGDVVPPLLPKVARKKSVFRICVLILVLPLVFALILFRIYGVDTKHESRGSIWWPERGRNLIPPAASEITLRRDLLDHYAVYTVTEKELNVFLDKRFAPPGKTLNSFSERLAADPDTVGIEIGPFGWEVTKNTVSYDYCASNGGVHSYYHDTKTGLTYQSSAYW